MPEAKSYILIVEDDVLFGGLQAMLLEDRGHRVVVCTDSQKALDQAKAVKPTVIVTDFELSPFNGIKFATRVRLEVDRLTEGADHRLFYVLEDKR